MPEITQSKWWALNPGLCDACSQALCGRGREGGLMEMRPCGGFYSSIFRGLSNFPYDQLSGPREGLGRMKLAPGNQLLPWVLGSLES